MDVTYSSSQKRTGGPAGQCRAKKPPEEVTSALGWYSVAELHTSLHEVFRPMAAIFASLATGVGNF